MIITHVMGLITPCSGAHEPPSIAACAPILSLSMPSPAVAGDGVNLALILNPTKRPLQNASSISFGNPRQQSLE